MKNLFLLAMLLAAAFGFSVLPAHAGDDDGLVAGAEPVAPSVTEPEHPIRSPEQANEQQATNPPINGDRIPPGERSLVAAKKPELLKKLKEFEGTYFMASKDENTACHNMLSSQDQDVRLNVGVEQKDNEYGAKAGNIKVELQQKWKHSGEWGRVFDRADFSNLNERKTVKRLGLLKITHVASYNEKKETLTHVSAMSQFMEGSSSAMQQIEFAKDKSEFTYTYSYQSKGEKKEVACKAVFKKKG